MVAQYRLKVCVKSDPTRSIMVICVKFFLTELMVEICCKSLEGLLVNYFS